MDITKFKTRMRLKSRRQTSQIATLPDVVSDLEAISAELNTTVKVTNSAQGGAFSDRGIGYPVSRVVGRDLLLNVAPFSVQGFSFSGGQIFALDNLRQFVGVNVHTGRLHCLPRLADEGFIPVAEVYAAGGVVTGVWSITPELPETRIPRTIAKLRNREAVKITVLGSSLLASADITTRHVGLISLVSDVGYGYSITNPAATAELNADPDFQQVGVFGWGGAPTGYTVQAAGGPNNSPCLEWSGGLRLFREVGTVNGVYTGTLLAIPVTGTPVVTMTIKDKLSDTVRGTSGAIPVSGLTTISASGPTAGGTAGVRVELAVAGGTVRFADLSITALSGATITTKNCAVGGSQAAYAFAIAASRPYRHQVTNPLVNDAAVEISHETAVQWAFTGPSGSPLATVLDADLVIVGGLANGGTDRDLLHEPLFYALRAAGCEVLLVTDNPQSPVVGTDPSTWGLYPDVTQLLASADAYGVAIADTSAYMTEAFLRGLPVYSDTIHQSTGTPAGASAQFAATGHECWAEALAGVASPTVIRKGVVQDVPTFRAQQIEQPGMAKVILPADVRVISGSTTLSAAGSGVSGNSDFAGLFGTPADKRRLQVPVGGKVTAAHPMMLRLQAVIQGNDFTAEIRMNNDVSLIRTVNFVAGAGGARTTLIDLVLPSELGVAVGNNCSVSITVTAGEMWLLGLVSHTPLYRDITDTLVFGGSGWAKESASHADVSVRYTDTVNDWVTAQDPACRSLVVGFNERTQGGTSVPVHDGVVLADQSHVGVSHFRFRKLTTGGALSRHQMSYRLKTAGAAPVAQNRSMAVVQAFAVLDR